MTIPKRIAALAFAGDFYEKEGVAIRGYDPVAYFTDKKPVRGSSAHKADRNWPQVAKQTKIIE